MTYALNIFNSKFFCLDIRQLQIIFASQAVLDKHRRQILIG